MASPSQVEPPKEESAEQVLKGTVKAIVTVPRKSVRPGCCLPGGARELGLAFRGAVLALPGPSTLFGDDTIISPATGSAHHQPRRAFKPMPASHCVVGRKGDP